MKSKLNQAAVAYVQSTIVKTKDCPFGKYSRIKRKVIENCIVDNCDIAYMGEISFFGKEYTVLSDNGMYYFYRKNKIQYHVRAAEINCATLMYLYDECADVEDEVAEWLSVA